MVYLARCNSSWFIWKTATVHGLFGIVQQLVVYLADCDSSWFICQTVTVRGLLFCRPVPGMPGAGRDRLQFLPA